MSGLQECLFTGDEEELVQIADQVYECGRGCLNTSHKRILTEYILHVWEVYIRLGRSRIWPVGYILGISHDYITSTALLGSSTLHSPPLGVPI